MHISKQCCLFTLSFSLFQICLFHTWWNTNNDIDIILYLSNSAACYNEYYYLLSSTYYILSKLSWWSLIQKRKKDSWIKQLTSSSSVKSPEFNFATTLAANCSFKSYLLSTIVKKKVKMQLQISIQPIQLQKTTVTVLENCSNSRLVLWYLESTYLCRLLGLHWLRSSQLTNEVLQFKLLYQYCQPSW